MSLSISCGLVALLIAGVDPTLEALDDRPRQDPIQAITDDVMGVVDVVLAEHFSPPTKQEMVAAAIRALNRTERFDPSERIAEESRIARVVSKANSDAELREMLFDSVEKSNSGGTSPELTAVGAFAIFSIVPGGGSIVVQQEHLIEVQIAANRYVGIGISLRSSEGQSIIQAVIPDGPCDRAGVPADSKILAIDGWAVSENLAEVVNHLRGPEGSEVVLVIQRPSSEEREEFRLTRGVVPFKHVHASEGGPPGQKVAILHISRLTPSVPHELRAYASRTTDLAGVIIDLSLTQPGTVHDAVLVADILLDSGEMGATFTVRGSQNVRLQPDALFQDLPMQVIVGRQTHGTAEWLAAALVESGRATLFGEPSAGAAVARESFTLPSGRYVVDLDTTVLLPKSGNRLMSSFDGRSLQGTRFLELRKLASPKPSDLTHGRLIPPEGAVQRLSTGALEPVFDQPNDDRRKFMQSAIDHFQKHVLTRTTSTNTNE